LQKFEVKSFADEKWWEVFQDPKLQELIRVALQPNYDVQIAAARILEAQASLGITRADQFPTVSGQATANNERSPRSKFVPAVTTSTNQVGLSLFWDLDFWGKYRRATEAARTNLLASEWARREIIAQLIANLTSAYFQLRVLDLQLEMYPAYLRGLAYLQLKKGDLAAAEFRKVLDHSGVVQGFVTGALSILQLARAQVLMHDEEAARKSYEDFLTLWTNADPDLPIYKEAKAEYAVLRKTAQ
jgi:Outer membrane efflux protein